MFDLKRPCKTCPFKRGNGNTFMLAPKRLDAIFEAVAFQCHSTVDYDQFDDPILRAGRKPQQCVGLMAILHREGEPNQIMQVAQRLIGFDAGALDATDIYSGFAEARAAHAGREP